MKALGPKTVNIATLKLAQFVAPRDQNNKKCLKALRTLYYKRVWGGEVVHRPRPPKANRATPRGSSH